MVPWSIRWAPGLWSEYHWSPSQSGCRWQEGMTQTAEHTSENFHRYLQQQQNMIHINSSFNVSKQNDTNQLYASSNIYLRVSIPRPVFSFPGIRNLPTSFPGFPGTWEWCKVWCHCQRHWLNQFSQLVVSIGLRAKKHQKDVQHKHFDRAKNVTCCLQISRKIGS